MAVLKIALVVALSSIITILAASQTGCGGDDPSGPLPTGTLTIDPEPDRIDAPWSITGPESFAASGNGDYAIGNVTIGNYMLTWGEVEGWDSPDPDQLTLSLVAHDTLKFKGEYTERLGTLVVDVIPNSSSASWTLTGPGGYLNAGSGDETVEGVDPGQYVIVWGQVQGRLTPDPETVVRVLGADSTVTFTGNYRRDLTDAFVLVPPGSFTMGSPASELGRDPSHETEHVVTLTKGFYIARYEVTRQWWDELMGGGDDDSQLPEGDRSWDAAVAFCNALSESEGLTPAYIIHGTRGDVTWNRFANGYRLPTEAEWEYACRAGTTTPFANGSIEHELCSPIDTTLDEAGWYCGNAGDRPRPVGSKAPNAWGLYDMHGNVREYCWDGYRADYETLPGEDPVVDAPPFTDRMHKGGSWDLYARLCRSAARTHMGPSSGVDRRIGIRLVRTSF